MLTRRAFVATTAAAAAAAPSFSWPNLAAAQAAGETNKPQAPALGLVKLGRTGRVLPRLGFGGFPICRVERAEALKIVERAIALGVRYFDTAPSYGGGISERRIGEAIAASGIDRAELFIATKTLRRDAEGARRELEESLKRLRVDYVDSIQAHEVHDDVESLFAEGSALSGLEKAKEEGLTRHIAITGHRNPRYLIEAIRRYDFATALVPINPADTKHLSFAREFLPVARERAVAVIAMKVFAGGSLLEGGRFTAGELLRYALSQEGVAIAIPGLGALDHVEQAYEAVAGFEPLSSEAQQKLEDRAGPHRGKSTEWYKDAR